MEQVDPQRMEKERQQKLLKKKPEDPRPATARQDMAVRRQLVQALEERPIFRVDKKEKFRASFETRE